MSAPVSNLNLISVKVLVSTASRSILANHGFSPWSISPRKATSEWACWQLCNRFRWSTRCTKLSHLFALETGCVTCWAHRFQVIWWFPATIALPRYDLYTVLNVCPCFLLLSSVLIRLSCALSLALHDINIATTPCTKAVYQKCMLLFDGLILSSHVDSCFLLSTHHPFATSIIMMRRWTLRQCDLESFLLSECHIRNVLLSSTARW